MNGRKLISLPTPTQDSDAATKKLVTDHFPRKQEVLGAFTMISSSDLVCNEVYGVNDNTRNKPAVNKQYVDNKKAFFKDGIHHNRASI